MAKHSPPDGRQETVPSVLITGGTGLIGQALIPVLVREGHPVNVLTRQPAKYPAHSARPSLFSTPDQIPDAHPINAVINLAGARIVGQRWTNTRKQVLRNSRIDLTRKLVEWMSRRPTPPTVLISGSASGYYGNRLQDPLTEEEVHGNDFGAQLCWEWEQESQRASALGTRVVILRTGLVLSDQGGMLPPLLQSFGLGMGCRVGDGTQWMSWVHIEDQVQAIIHLLKHPESKGAYNLSSPEPVTNTDFSRCLAKVLRRPCLFSLPAPILRIALGEAAELLLGGQRMQPKKLLQEGYTFRHPNLENALRILSNR